MRASNVITTERCVLRPLEMTDAEDIFNYRSLPEVYKYQTWKPKSKAEVEEFIANLLPISENTPGTWFQMAICLKSGNLIGDIGVHFLDADAQVEIGYTLSPAFQGQGYASETISAVMDHLFNDLGEHRITASVDPENERSILLLERLGFRKEAHFIESFQVDGIWYDDCVYAMLRKEWENKLLTTKTIK